MLARLDVEPVYVRAPSQLAQVQGLIIPGGESTTMLKLLDEENLFDPIVDFAGSHSLFGTCAGTILMASEVSHPPQRAMKLLDIAVERNAYGRQLDSSVRRIEPSEEFTRRTAPGEFEAVFIRAPIIRRTGAGACVLARQGNDPVLVEQGRHLVATFHPELTQDDRVHHLFFDLIRSNG
jgi:5'-phosphate synthase pdxT subunit